jgi:beta-lactamase regulating signal transducer with metallopeptidase domain
MVDYIARPLYYLGVHLLYASMVWLAAWVLTSIPRGSATTKYWIWLVTSLNFILPLGVVLDKLLARHLAWARPLSVIGNVGLGIAQNAALAVPLGIVWLLGAALMFMRLCLLIRAERRDAHVMSSQNAHDQRPGFLAHGIQVKFVGSAQVPAVDGVLHPHISLPEGIDRVLSEHELNAVLLHELTHAKRRDNLIRLVHELGACALWFHPLVWITGSRLSLYRELSCDESVIRSARGEDLVSALAKLANPQEALLLQATVSSFLSHRLARLAAAQPPRTSRGASALLTVAFGAVLVAGVFETVAHTACCFILRK